MQIKEEPNPQPLNETRWAGKRLSFCPYLDSLAGYHRHALELFKNFESLGVFVSVRPLFTRETEEARIAMPLKRAFVNREQKEDWQLILSPASYKPMQRKRDLYYSMYECSRFTPKQVKLLNRSAAVAVPCDWNVHGFRESGGIVPCYKIPLGFNDDTFKPSEMDMTGPCTFGVAGRMAHGYLRKNMNFVVSAFLKEFPNEKDVFLHVKGFKDCQTQYVFDRRVIVREGFISDAQLAEWMRNLTCFISAARGEAWGLMQLESCSVGRPVISPLHGGVREFLTPENSYPLDYREGPSEEAWSISGGQWAIPDEGHLRHLMRRCYNDRAEAQRIGLVAADTTKQFTWKNSAIRCLQVLEELGAI